MAPISLRVKVKVKISSPRSTIALRSTYPAPASHPPGLCSHTPGSLQPQGALAAPSEALSPSLRHGEHPLLFPVCTLESLPDHPTPPQIPFPLIFPLSTFYHLLCVFQLFISLTSHMPLIPYWKGFPCCSLRYSGTQNWRQHTASTQSALLTEQTEEEEGSRRQTDRQTDNANKQQAGSIREASQSDSRG